MNISITVKNIELTPAIRAHVEQKIGDLEHLIGHGEVSAAVEVGKPSRHHRAGQVFYAEVNLKIGGAVLRAQAERDDLYVAVNEVRDELQTQIKKFKEKRG